MKTSGIVALAIVVASMEVADAKCYIGFRSGYWQGTVNAAVTGGMVYIPAMTSKKIMIRGFSTTLNAGGLGQFYAGLKNLGVGAGAIAVQGNGGGANGQNLEFIHLPKAQGNVNPVDNSDDGELTLDLTWVTTVTGFDPSVQSAGALHWLLLAKSDDVSNTQYAKYDFQPHFRGGFLTGMLYEIFGETYVEGSRATDVKTRNYRQDTTADGGGENVRGFFGKKSWFESRDELAKLTSGVNNDDYQIYYYADVTDDGTKLLSSKPLQATIDIGSIVGITDVREIKWMAIHNAKVDGAIAAYVSV